MRAYSAINRPVLLVKKADIGRTPAEYRFASGIRVCVLWNEVGRTYGLLCPVAFVRGLRMKITRTGLAAIMILVTQVGCEEFVNPKAGTNAIPVLHCIIPTSGAGTDVKPEVVLTRVYDVDGVDPSVNRIDPSILGAEITLFHRGKSYRMNERSYPRHDTSRYVTNQSHYWTILPALMPGDTVSLFARTPQGEVLTTSTDMPQWQYFETSIEFAAGFTTDLNRFIVGDSWTFTWNEEENHIFFPRLRLWYRKYTDSVRTLYSREVPLSYVVRNGVGIPVYPTYQWSNSASYSLSSFDSVMTQISAGDPDKLRYKIDYFTFTLEECDRHLSRYYSSVRGYLDEYSVRLDEPVFTNVTGGIGIFGSYRSTSVEYLVDLAYVHSFGYQ